LCLRWFKLSPFGLAIGSALATGSKALKSIIFDHLGFKNFVFVPSRYLHMIEK
jgi:hypothetical protein